MFFVAVLGSIRYASIVAPWRKHSSFAVEEFEANICQPKTKTLVRGLALVSLNGRQVNGNPRRKNTLTFRRGISTSNPGSTFTVRRPRSAARTMR